jgi:hypothetical protein
VKTTAVTSVEDQMLNQTSKTCFSRIGEMNKFYKKTEKCWKETTLKITLFSLNK